MQDERIVMKREILDKMRMASHRFTIEQFELLRRLRASGITKDEVVLAFENFDRVEWELQVGRVSIVSDQRNKAICRKKN